MTGFVEILEVQRVIHDLVDCVGYVVFFSYLEFQHKNHRANDANGINALAHARDGVFKIDLPRVTLQDLFQDADLFDPGIPLGLL